MSMISLSDLLRRKDPSSQAYANLENSIDEAFAEAISEVEQSADQSLTDVDVPSADAAPSSDTDILSAHAQSRMAAFKVFDEANRTARDELTRIGRAFTTIVTSYNLGRDFLEDCEDEIVRASELEQANLRFAAESRRLQERHEKHERIRERQDDLIQSMKQREARLLQDADALRDNLSDVRMELVESRNANAIVEGARNELHLTLASKVAEVERLHREMESLTEKHALMTAELEKSQKRQAESRRKVEELQATQSAEVSRSAELSDRLAVAERECLRLQKQLDFADGQMGESMQGRRTAEQEMREAERRHHTELLALRAELEQWKGSLQNGAAARSSETTRPAATETAPAKDRPMNRDISVTKSVTRRAAQHASAASAT